jgi:hypothetical protein
MAAGKHTYVGGAKPVQQIVTYTVEATPTDTEVFSIGLFHPSGASATELIVATHTASSDTGADVAASLAAQWNASRHAWAYGGGPSSWLGGAIAVANGAVVTLSAKVSGRPFVTEVGSTTTGTLTKNEASTTFFANSGPEDLRVPGNWADGVVPADTGDDLEFTGPYSIKFGLDLDGIACDVVNVRKWRGRELGWPQMPLLLDPDEFIYDSPQGGNAYIQLLTSATPSVLIWNAGRCLHLSGGNASIAGVQVYAGQVEFAATEADAFAAALLANYGAEILIGNNATFAAVRQTTGSLRDSQDANRSGATVIDGGRYWENTGTSSSNTLASVTVRGGSAMLMGASTITQFNGYGGNSDMVSTQIARTITDSEFAPSFVAIGDRVTLTNAPTILGSLVRGSGKGEGSGGPSLGA